MNTMKLNDQTLYFFAHEQANAPLSIVFVDKSDVEPLANKIQNAHSGSLKTAILLIDEPNWERAFTPWQAAGVFRKAPDFAGEANATLAQLCQQTLPEIEQTFTISPSAYYLLGYSLAGLFAAYCAYQTPQFSRIASVSGSLWYDGWCDFVQHKPAPTFLERAYFSLGDSEKNSKNERMAQVENHTRATVAAWQNAGINTHCHLNQGGHFQDTAERTWHALLALSA